MIIKSKKSGKEEYISRDGWEKLTKMGYASGWLVIDNSDEPIPDNTKEIPAQITEFANKREVMKDLDNMLKDELIIFASENGIEINTRLRKSQILNTIKDGLKRIND